MLDFRKISYYLLSFLIPFVGFLNYTLNHFYVQGAYFLDSGWFAFLSRGFDLQLSNPPSLGGTFLSTHFSPVFLAIGAIGGLFPSHGIGQGAVIFSIFLALCASIMGISVHATARIASPPENATQSAGLVVLAVISAFNGAMLAALGFPHFEIAIPALILLSLALHVRGKPWGAVAVLALCVTVREDAGLHAALIYGTIYLVKAFRGRDLRIGGTELAIAFGCAAYAVAAIAIQKRFFPGDDALARVYFGNPPLAHVTADFVRGRIADLFPQKLYLVLPIILTVGWSVLNRRLSLMIAVVATLPWFTLNLLALSPQAGSLVSYYAFPLAVTLAWPVFAGALDRRGTDSVGSSPAPTSFFIHLLVAGGSLAAFATAGGVHDRWPLRHVGFDYVDTVKPVGDFAASLNIDPARSIIVDDAVASLAPEKVGPANWRYGMSFPEAGPDTTVIFFEKSWVSDRITEIRKQAHLDMLYRVPGTPIRIAMSSSNPNVPAGAESLGSVFGIGQSPNSEVMAPLLATGWSSAEKTGRWTDGDVVEFPSTYIKDEVGGVTVCIDGHPFVTAPDHIVSGRLSLNDRPIGDWVFKAGSQRACATDVARHPAGTYLKPTLALSGIRSPKEAGLSADTRRLGVFVTQVYIGAGAE